MDNKLYVGNLSYSTTNDSLQAAFAACGQVQTATVIIDKMTGRSKGFGFVEMSSAAEATSAIEMMDGKELDGRTIRVSIAQPLKERPPRDNFRGGNGGGRSGGFGRNNDHGGSNW